MSWAHSRRFGALLLLACSAATEVLPHSPRLEPRAAGLHAGVAVGDITPPPGLALFGHGPEGRIATGARTRLRCQAFVLASANDIVALVPCDLAAPDLQLQRRIAARLLEDGVPIGGDRLFLMATHTHAGPAHYFTSRRYSGSFSSYRPGFDPEVVEFLVARIASVVKTAFGKLAPASAGWGQRQVYGLTRNRSYTPFTANEQPATPSAPRDLFERSISKVQGTSGTTLDESEGEAGITTNVEPRSHTEAAVDPTLWVLRIDGRDVRLSSSQATSSQPIGVLAIFGMHPTGISNRNELYHGDIFGFATREVEACIVHEQQTGDKQRPPFCGSSGTSNDALPFVAGLANGIEGDVSPAVDFQAPREAQRLGVDLAHQILATYDAIPTRPGLDSDFDISHAYRELVFPGARVTPNSNEWLCTWPAIGASAAGGAEDGPTRFRIIPAFNEGRRRRSSGDACQGAKLELIPPEGSATKDGLQFPALAPIALVGIGRMHLATAPAELTTVAGLRVESAVRERLGPNPVAVVGLTNAYVQYVATREEYPFQHYEGASTLYGPNSAAFLTSQFGCLATWLSAHDDASCRAEQPHAVNSLAPFERDPLPVVRRLYDERADPTDRVELIRSAPITQDGIPGWEVRIAGVPAAALAHRDRFSVHVIVASDGRSVDDDMGPNMELRWVDEWRVRWLPYIVSADDPRCKETYRVRVTAQQQATSEPFRLACRNVRRP